MTTQQIDATIQQQFNRVAELKAEVEKTEKETKRGWKTNCSFVHPALVNSPINLNVVSESDVFHAMVELMNFKAGAERATEVLGLDASAELMYRGYSVQDWIDDMKKRIAMCQLKARKDKLNQLEKRLSAIISPEQKRQMELDAILKELE